jgi:hypothetical protein
MFTCFARHYRCSSWLRCLCPKVLSLLKIYIFCSSGLIHRAWEFWEIGLLHPYILVESEHLRSSWSSVKVWWPSKRWSSVLDAERHRIGVWGTKRPFPHVRSFIVHMMSRWSKEPDMVMWDLLTHGTSLLWEIQWWLWLHERFEDLEHISVELHHETGPGCDLATDRISRCIFKSSSSLCLALCLPSVWLPLVWLLLL